MAKEGKLKRYQDRVKEYNKNRTFQSKERKFNQQVKGVCMRTYEQLDANEATSTNVPEDKKTNDDA